MQPEQGCCEPELHAWFQRETLFKIGLRHTGSRCAGRIDGLVRAAWFDQSRYLRNGEVYK